MNLGQCLEQLYQSLTQSMNRWQNTDCHMSLSWCLPLQPEPDGLEGCGNLLLAPHVIIVARSIDLLSSRAYRLQSQEGLWSWTRLNDYRNCSITTGNHHFRQQAVGMHLTEKFFDKTTETEAGTLTILFLSHTSPEVPWPASHHGSLETMTD